MIWYKKLLNKQAVSDQSMIYLLLLSVVYLKLASNLPLDENKYFKSTVLDSCPPHVVVDARSSFFFMINPNSVTCCCSPDHQRVEKQLRLSLCRTQTWRPCSHSCVHVNPGVTGGRERCGCVTHESLTYCDRPRARVQVSSLWSAPFTHVRNPEHNSRPWDRSPFLNEDTDSEFSLCYCILACIIWTVSRQLAC